MLRRKKSHPIALILYRGSQNSYLPASTSQDKVKTKFRPQQIFQNHKTKDLKLKCLYKTKHIVKRSKLKKV